MKKQNEMEAAFEKISKVMEQRRNEGLTDQSVYIQRYNSIQEMQEEMGLRDEEIEEVFQHQEKPKGAFIMKDYNLTDVDILEKFDEESVNRFIETITLP